MEQHPGIALLEKKLVFADTFEKVRSVMEQNKGKHIMVSYSGGADSDNVLWLLRALGYNNVKAVFFDTGIEWRATVDHINWMRSQGFVIEEAPAVRKVATSQREIGYAFISKKASEMLFRLQNNHFNFQEHGALPFEELIKLYPRSRSALRWWTGYNVATHQLCIYAHPYLKEFLTKFGLGIKVASRCCDGAKKMPSKVYAKKFGVDLMITGVRRAEGGTRASAYKACFLPAKHAPYDLYMPLFWWKDEDKEEFEKALGINHSRCYTEYGLDRTGCAGCPYGKYHQNEVAILEKHEPKLAKGIKHIFGPSYEWTAKYMEFRNAQKAASVKPENLPPRTGRVVNA